MAFFVDARLDSDVLADRALAITVASLRPLNPHSEEVLGRDWKRGFVGDAARAGRAGYERARHSDHWLVQAAEASDPHQRWRYTELAVAAADRRQLLANPSRITPDLRLMGGDIAQRLDKAGEKSNTDAKKSLFGWKKPMDLLARILR